MRLEAKKNNERMNKTFNERYNDLLKVLHELEL